MVSVHPASRAELLHVLMLPDFERADRIGEFWGCPQSREFAETPDRLRGGSSLRAVLVGILRETETGRLLREGYHRIGSLTNRVKRAGESRSASRGMRCGTPPPSAPKNHAAMK
jgi:hypothetical protein